MKIRFSSHTLNWIKETPILPTFTLNFTSWLSHILMIFNPLTKSKNLSSSGRRLWSYCHELNKKPKGQTNKKPTASSIILSSLYCFYKRKTRSIRFKILCNRDDVLERTSVNQNHRNKFLSNGDSDQERILRYRDDVNILTHPKVLKST